MKQPKSDKKKPVKPIDFQKALAEKQAEEFSKSIENDSLYEELRPKKNELTNNIITFEVWK